MDIAKSETFKYFIILKRALLFLFKVNKTAVQSVQKDIIYYTLMCRIWFFKGIFIVIDVDSLQNR